MFAQALKLFFFFFIALRFKDFQTNFYTEFEFNTEQDEGRNEEKRDCREKQIKMRPKSKVKNDVQKSQKQNTKTGTFKNITKSKINKIK